MINRYDFAELPQILLKRPHGLIFLLGEPDTGKTTLFKQIAQAFLDEGLRIGLIDSDAGQSTIGPPTTIGMVIAEERLPDFSHPQQLYFVGNNNPVGRIMEVVVGSGRMVDEAKHAGADTVLFDSSGLVQPPYGTVLKYNKLELLQPRYIVAIEKENELSPILAWLGCRDIEVLHTRPSEYARVRPVTERTKYRQEKYREYFKQASLRTLRLGELCLYPSNFLQKKVDPIGLLVGLQDEDWNTACIGIIESLESNTISIFAPCPPQTKISGLVAGYIKLSKDGVELDKFSSRIFS